MAVTYTTRKGHKVVLRNPAEKAKRFAWQLTHNQVGETGKTLTKNDRAYRMGYLTARSDNAKAYKSNRKRGR